MYRFYDYSDSTILPEDCYESNVPIPRFFRVLLLKVVQILRFYLRIVMKVMYRFYSSSDSTILSEDCYALISGHPGGLTLGNPRAFAPRHLQIPPTQGQYSSTKSYYCPSPRSIIRKDSKNFNVILCLTFDISLTIIYAVSKNS